MSRNKMHMRGRRTLLLLAAGIAAVAVAAAPGLAQGLSPELLAEQGWSCFVPPVAGAGTVCFNPAEGRPPVPSLGAAGRPSYSALRWTPGGEFLGQTHLIRADLYNGQPCAQLGGGYRFIPLIGYWECLRP